MAPMNLCSTTHTPTDFSNSWNPWQLLFPKLQAADSTEVALQIWAGVCSPKEHNCSFSQHQFPTCDFSNPEIPHMSSKRALHHKEAQQTTREGVPLND